MRPYCFAPFLLLAASLPAQVRVQVLSEPTPTEAHAEAQLAAAPGATYDATLSLLTGWGFPIQLAEARNGVIVTSNLTVENAALGNVGKLLGKRAGYWLDCGKDFFFSRAATAAYINYQFIILIAGDSTVSVVEVNLFASAVEEDDPLFPITCSSRDRLEPVFGDSLRARLTASD